MSNEELKGSAPGKKSVVSNFLWRFAERCGAQIIQFLVSIVLARILAPEAYGTVALILVFATILQVFVDSGLGNALIQKKDADDLDFSTVFWFNVGWCLMLYAIIFFCAPLIADFYNDESLTAVVRVLCLTVVVSGLKNVQQAYVSRTMQFKRFFWATLGGTLVSAVAGITIALLGGGVWALVAQKLVNLTIDTTVLWFTVKWRPKWMFSWKRWRVLFSFGWKLLVSALVDTVYNNLRQLIIGKFYSKSDLAFFNQGKQFPNIIVTNINTSIDSVLLPTMSKVQDDPERVKQMTRRSIKTSTYLMAPLMMGLAFCADTVVKLVLTDKWLPCVPFLQIFCVTYMFFPIHTANLNAIKAMGRSDLFLILEIVKKAVGLAVLFSTVWFGVMVMAYSLFVTSILNQIINSWPNKKLMNYSYLEQLKDILPGIGLALIMGICVKAIEFIPLAMPTIVMLIMQVVVGAAVYIILSKLFSLEAYHYLMDIVKSFLSKKKKKEKV